MNPWAEPFERNFQMNILSKLKASYKKENKKTIGLRVAPYGHACRHGCLKTSFPHP